MITGEIKINAIVTQKINGIPNRHATLSRHFYPSHHHCLSITPLYQATFIHHATLSGHFYPSPHFIMPLYHATFIHHATLARHFCPSRHFITPRLSITPLYHATFIHHATLSRHVYPSYQFSRQSQPSHHSFNCNATLPILVSYK